jgi:hypothetical protein
MIALAVAMVASVVALLLTLRWAGYKVPQLDPWEVAGWIFMAAVCGGILLTWQWLSRVC